MTFKTPDAYFESIHRIMSVLDEENIKIINTMKKFGPRNLQKVSRKSGVPYPTVYTRVNKLESEGLLQSSVYPNFAKIGLARAMVLLTPAPGRELLAREALKIPSYWVSLMRCSGECNGYFSLHAVPADKRQDFEQYLDQLMPAGVATNYRIFWLGEFRSNTPNFEYFDLKKKTWKFNFSSWLKLFTDEKKREKIEEEEFRRESFDKNDLLILKELMKDARKKLSEFARMIGVTLPAAKYRFDNIVRKGLINDYIIQALPYAPDVSDLFEVRLDFRNENLMAGKERVLQDLPFVLSYSRIKGSNSLSVRVYLPRTEINNLLLLLSGMVRKGVLDRFSYLALDAMTIERQTFSYERYDDGSGWHYDNREYLNTLRKLVSNFEKEEILTIAFQPMAVIDSRVI